MVRLSEPDHGWDHLLSIIFNLPHPVVLQLLTSLVSLQLAFHGLEPLSLFCIELAFGACPKALELPMVLLVML